MDKPNQEQILKIFQSLFSKEQLRKNLYLFQYLNPDMTLRIKTICQQRKVAAVSKDPYLIFECLKKCPLVKIIDQETIRILVNGDALIVRVRGLRQKQISFSEIKKLMVPLLKDIKYEIRQNKNIVGKVQTQGVEIQLQSETSAAEFIQRIKAKNAPVDWQLKEKDPYQCIRKSIKYLLKERKNQQQGNYPGSSYYAPQIYPQNYYNNYQQAPQTYVPHKYQPTKPSYSNYPIFIRKAVESSDQQPYQNDKQPQKQKDQLQRKPKIYQAKKQKNNNNGTSDANDKKIQPTKAKDNAKVINFGSDDFPTL